MENSNVWKCNELHMHEIEELLRKGSCGDSRSQEEARNGFAALANVPDGLCYLCDIFCNNQISIEIRQLAGIQMKNNITNDTPTWVLSLIKPLIMTSLTDIERIIRTTATSAISSLIAVRGTLEISDILDWILNTIETGNDECSIDGAFTILLRICEDELLVSNKNTTDDRFVSYCHIKLLPKLLHFSLDVHQPSKRNLSVTCLTYFIQSHSLAPGAPFDTFFSDVWTILGSLALDPTPIIRQNVLSCMIQIMDFHPEAIFQSGEAIFNFMVEASGDNDASIQLEALEFWNTALRESVWKPRAIEHIRACLPRLIPTLVRGTEYKSADYACMDADVYDESNADQPDMLSECVPRFHNEKKNDDDRESKGTWGGGWTCRKGSALALDHLANTFNEELLPDLLPLVESRLTDPNWEIRESAVLTLGAIAPGCTEALSPYLGKVLEYLINLCDESKPLVRSISCWCLSRFSFWISQEENADVWLEITLAKLLKRILDPNKKVQEAACSAFAVLEEDAREQLSKYLPEIIKTLRTALSFYQAKNLLILYDAVGTFAECVCGALQDENIAKELLVPLLEHWNVANVAHPSLIALYECINSCATAMEKGFSPYAEPVVDKCCTVIASVHKEIQKHDAGLGTEAPSRELIECSLDLLSGVIEALGENFRLLLQNCHHDIAELLVVCCRDNETTVLQSAFALVGDLSKHCSHILVPNVKVLLPLLSKNLLHKAASVSNNAGWAIGELCLECTPEVINPYVLEIGGNLVSLLYSPNIHRSLLQNVCITIGRLGIRNADAIQPLLDKVLEPWCFIVTTTRNDKDKLHAFQGICNIIMLNPEPAALCLKELVNAIMSFHPWPEVLHSQFFTLLKGLKDNYSAKWQEFVAVAQPAMIEQLYLKFPLEQG